MTAREQISCTKPFTGHRVEHVYIITRHARHAPCYAVLLFQTALPLMDQAKVQTHGNLDAKASYHQQMPCGRLLP